MLEKLANLKREISYLQDRVTDLEDEAERLTEDYLRNMALPPQIARDLLAIVKEHTP